jgi:glc operon protein GlcG
MARGARRPNLETPLPERDRMHRLDTIRRFVWLLPLLGFCWSAWAQQPPPQRPPYGPAITLDTAKKIAAAAVAEARKNSWNVAVAITDNHGMLVYYEMLDDTQTASANVAVEKARTSAGYRRPSKEFEDNIAAGRVAVLGLPGVTPIDGGLPIVVNGRMIGAIGVSGVTSAQDAQIARAGLESLK